MKLQYFNQAAADIDDDVLRSYIMGGLVPATCLVGGEVIYSIQQTTGADPCGSCDGPRSRCHGRPKVSEEESNAAGERERLRVLFTGDSSALDAALFPTAKTPGVGSGQG